MPRTYFDGDVAIVTGGGRGLGRAYCLELARLGARLVVNDVSADAADQAVQAIEAEGGSAVASHHSVSTREGARTIVRTALERFGTVDALINNAGSTANGLFEDMTPEMLDCMLDVHVRGSFFVTQAAWPTMRARGYGRVVMTSSSLALFPSGGSTNYAAAKGALYGLCMSLAYSGRQHGILVNLLAPNASTTISAGNPEPNLAGSLPPGLGAALAPLRLTEAVAPFAAYLVSRACSLSGETFTAGMGHFARVFVGSARGWAAPDPAGITIDDIAGHIEEIRDLEAHRVPESLYDDVEAIAETIGLNYG